MRKQSPLFKKENPMKKRFEIEILEGQVIQLGQTRITATRFGMHSQKGSEPKGVLSLLIETDLDDDLSFIKDAGKQTSKREFREVLPAG